MPACCAAAWLRTSTLARVGVAAAIAERVMPLGGPTRTGSELAFALDSALRFLGPARSTVALPAFGHAALGFSALPYPLVCLSGVTAPSCSTTGVETTSWVFGRRFSRASSGSSARAGVPWSRVTVRADVIVTAMAFAQP